VSCAGTWHVHGGTHAQERRQPCQRKRLAAELHTCACLLSWFTSRRKAFTFARFKQAQIGI
jgi:hypothetical protein